MHQVNGNGNQCLVVWRRPSVGRKVKFCIICLVPSNTIRLTLFIVALYVPVTSLQYARARAQRPFSRRGRLSMAMESGTPDGLSSSDTQSHDLRLW